MATARLYRALAHAWVLLLSVVVLGPALGPGFTLSYDLVFTPRQDLLPSSLGLGGGLPRAVPQDAVVALLETVVPGSLLEKAVLIAIPLLAGAGMLRLLPGTMAGTVAATIAIANPFVAQRLVIGHWGLLLAYALVPWALHIARRLRAAGDPWDGVRLLVIVAVGSLTPSGSLLLSLLVVPPVLLPGSAYGGARRALLLAAVLATWLPWLLPAVLHPLGTGSDPRGSLVFALRPDAPGGPVLAALTGGGIWNAEVVLPSRESPLTLVFAVTVLVLAAVGIVSLGRAMGAPLIAWWGGVAGVGLVAALASVVLPGAWEYLLGSVPGAGLARDSHKLLAPWVLLLAAAAGMGGARLADVGRDRATRTVIAAALVVLPLASQPDLAWGAGGRLAAVEYPGEWSEARRALQADRAPGDVVSFPWTAFRQFPWNDGRTVLDPAPRWLPRTTVVADSLVVMTPRGAVSVTGDDPRAREVTRAFEGRLPVADLLPRLGIGWALVAHDTPGPVPALPGWRPVVAGSSLTLYAAPGTVVPRAAPDIRLVAAVDASVAAGLLAALAALGWNVIRRVRAREPVSLVR